MVVSFDYGPSFLRFAPGELRFSQTHGQKSWGVGDIGSMKGIRLLPTPVLNPPDILFFDLIVPLFGASKILGFFETPKAEPILEYLSKVFCLASPDAASEVKVVFGFSPFFSPQPGAM